MGKQVDFQLVVAIDHHIIIIKLKASDLPGPAYHPDYVHVLLSGDPGIDISDSCCVHVVRHNAGINMRLFFNEDLKKQTSIQCSVVAELKYQV